MDVSEMRNTTVDQAASANEAECGETFAMFITNIAIKNTEGDIDKLVRKFLKTYESDKINVKILVPKGRELNDLDYVSFEVTVDSRLKSLAMKPSTWPKGVKYRQFINQSFSWHSWNG